jgi:hypothetical protein
MVVFVSCDKVMEEEEDNSSPTSPTPIRGGISGIIEGEYASWDFVGISIGSKIVEATPIIDGKFTFASLPTPKSEDLEPFVTNEEILSGLQISDKDVKICNLSLLAIKSSVDASYEGRGIMQVVIASNSATMIFYYYADRDVIIKSLYSNISTETNRYTAINLNLKRGWNSLYFITENGFPTAFKNGVPPPGTAWKGIFLIPANNNQGRLRISDDMFIKNNSYGAEK